MRLWPQPHSLAIRILSAVFMAVALAVAITGTYSIVEERRALDRIFVKQGNTIARALAAFSIEQLVSLDYPALEHALETIARHDDTIDLIEVTRNGRVVAHYGIEERPGREFTADIKLQRPNEEVLGQVRLIMSPKDSEAVVSLHLRDQAIYLILLFVVLAFSLHWILKQLVIRPIRRLTDETEQVINEAQPTPAQAEINHGDQENEIELLTRRFREMLDGLRRKDRERSHAEKELETYKDNLEALVEQRTRELWVARENALRSARIKSEFLTNMSHEIRTPLNGVLGLAQIGHRNTSADPENHEVFARILDSGNLLLGILNDILDLSRLEAGKLRIDFQPASPRRCMDNVIDLLRQRAEDKAIRLVVECPGDFPEACLIDPLRLEQVLMNLLSNAIKFTEHGEVTLRASASHDELLFQVCDSGIGIAPENLTRIFTPFEQADTSTTRRFGGSGLGLTITRQLVEMMGGHISVCSTPGQGSDFSVILPFRPAVLGSAGHGVAALTTLPGLGRLSGRHILVAEDNAINQLVIERMLQAEGAEVTLAANGREAVVLATNPEEAPFDVILMDIQMPEMNGYEATRRILQARPSQLIVGLTAHAFDEDREQCLLAGMAGHITKPIEAEHLAQVLAQHLVLPHQQRLPFAETPAVPAPPEEAPGKINWQALEDQFGKDSGMVTKLQTTFIATCEDWPQRVGQAVKASDFPEIARLAHEIRGATGFLKAYDLMDSARATEIAARDGKPIAQDLARCLANDIEELVDEARDLLARQPAPAGTPGAAPAADEAPGAMAPASAP